MSILLLRYVRYSINQIEATITDGTREPRRSPIFPIITATTSLKDLVILPLLLMMFKHVKIVY